MLVTLVGHATVAVELDGVRLLTDPLLRHRVLFLRGPGGIAAATVTSPDAVLLSHFHRDHYDPRSLRRLDPATLVLGPPGTGVRARRQGLANVVELRPGDAVEVGRVTVRATKAAHGRVPAGLGHTAVGFLVRGSETVYFAGDTELFPEMAALAEEHVDVALLPVGGWGPRLGSGHLDPRRAAEALRLVRPRIAIPIHFGFLRPLGLGRLRPRYLTEPGRTFEELAAELAPEVHVCLLAPGEQLDTASDGQ